MDSSRTRASERSCAGARSLGYFGGETGTLTQHFLNSNTTLLLMHVEDFAPCTTYWIFVDGSDLEGQGVLMTPQTPGPPNPWTFTTACNVFTITRTDPADNQTEVVVN